MLAKSWVKVCHLFTRSKNGLMVQILSGLMAYLLLVIYCHEEHKVLVSIRGVRLLRNQVRNEVNQQYAAEIFLSQHQKRKKKRWGTLKKSIASS